MLNVSEVNLVLGSYLEFARAREPDYQPNPLLEKSLEYAKRFCTSRNKDALQKMRECVQGTGGKGKEQRTGPRRRKG